MQHFVYYCLFFASLLYLVSSTIETVHLLFRHGERCPDKRFMHPKDPYRNRTFAPYGLGQMTNFGKNEVYNLGIDIKKRYKALIGESYNYDLVDPWSSAIPRTQMTMMLVLAGIYKPASHEIWNKELLWQPVPFKYIPSLEDDDIFLTVVESDQYINEYKRSFDRNSINIMKKYNRTIQDVKELIDLKIRNTRDALTLYLSLETADCVGYPLPKWFRPIADGLEKLAAHDYHMQIKTRTLKRLAIGKLLKKIVEDTNAKIKNETQYKLHLYSGHDVNIAHVLLSLAEFDVDRIIPYAACVALEVHKHHKNRYNIHVVYKEGSHSYWKTICVLSFHSLEKMVEDMFGTDARASGNMNDVYTSYLVLSTIFACLLQV